MPSWTMASHAGMLYAVVSESTTWIGRRFEFELELKT
jgi:hypothetical protein